MGGPGGEGRQRPPAGRPDSCIQDHLRRKEHPTTPAYIEWLLSDIEEKAEVNSAKFEDERYYQLLTELRTEIEKGHVFHVVHTQ